MMKKNKKQNKQKKNRARVREIMEVLRRRDIFHGITPEKARLILEDLGPTFIKLGQIMSMRADILPKEYCEEFRRLRTEVNPMTAAQVREVLNEEYGQPVEEVFAAFDDRPVGSASIAQVHRATLPEGEEVVVKVQRPGIRDVMARDIALLRKLSGVAGAVSGTGDVLDLRMVLDEMWSAAQQELDFMIEAHHLDEFREKNSTVVYIDCPKIEYRLTTSKVLVMEYIDGLPIDHVDELEALGYDMEEIGAKLADNYVKQITEDAFFHADPHPGNIWIRGGQIVYLDLGMMGTLTDRDRMLFKNSLRAVTDKDVEALKSILLSLGAVKGKVNHSKLYEDIDAMLTKYAELNLEDMDLGTIIEELIGIAKENNITMPKGMTMLSRGVLTIEGVLEQCSPKTNILRIFANRMSGSLLGNIDVKKEMKGLLRSAYSSGRKLVDLPSYVVDILKMTIKGQTKVNLELTGSEEPLSKIDSMVNRLIVCIITAAVLIGSSLLCLTDMKPKILGIPFLGALGFAAAMVLSIFLLISVLKKK